MNDKGRVKVHNSGLCSELLGDGHLDIVHQAPAKAVSTDTCIRVSPRGLSKCSTSQGATNAVEWLSRKARRAVVALPDDPKLTQLKQTCEHIIRAEHELLLELNKFLEEEEGYELSKKAMLYKKWNERVFEPILKEIGKKMESQDYYAFSTTKRELFEKYLQYNTKQDVFLDTISHNEYNPVIAKELKITTNPLSDPLKAHTSDADNKTSAIKGCEKGASLNKLLVPTRTSHSQRGSEAVWWLAMKLVYIDSESGQIRRKRVCHDHNICTDSSTEEQLQIPHKRKGQCDKHQSLSLQWKEYK